MNLIRTKKVITYIKKIFLIFKFVQFSRIIAIIKVTNIG